MAGAWHSEIRHEMKKARAQFPDIDNNNET
jgi:hypothetical protein